MRRYRRHTWHMLRTRRHVDVDAYAIRADTLRYYHFADTPPPVDVSLLLDDAAMLLTATPPDACALRVRSERTRASRHAMLNIYLLMRLRF